MKPQIALTLDKNAWRPSALLRQIMLVTTLNANDVSNIAPKSWVSMMAFDPPLLALGCNLKHWTAQNILARQEFVVNAPGAEVATFITSRMSFTPAHPSSHARVPSYR
jgi:flavin reductase (DIM6/NTAB) family NADH-FMN oxidoreductase RutF